MDSNQDKFDFWIQIVKMHKPHYLKKTLLKSNIMFKVGSCCTPRHLYHKFIIL
ncbi:hypothetical protein HanPI659440_Chr14g0556721 [Helianthus annuus]|nr:hypothetical protein HanPI659440_Chr14g0556721 [Helianthus annuus]